MTPEDVIASAVLQARLQRTILVLEAKIQELQAEQQDETENVVAYRKPDET